MKNMSLPHVNGYEVVEKIGVGSFSVVYKAFTKTASKETVAVKCIDKRYQKKSFADNVVKEITLLKLLRHDYIVRLIDFMWDVKYIFIITEYCDEGDLSTFIRKRHKLSETLVKTFMQQLALALKFLHGYKICHMDLKPQNLLLLSTPSLRLKVADFGLSQIICSENVEEIRYAGSLLYMAPEKLLHQQFDARVDLWSVGVIMYECLFGRPPFINLNAKKILEIMYKKQPIELPAHINISPACERFLTSLLKYQPDERLTFDAYFQHEFLDLVHVANSDNYLLTTALLEQAIELDEEKKYAESLPKYKEACKYLEAFITVETDPNRKAVLRQRLQEYTVWIGTLTDILDGKTPAGVNNPPTLPPQVNSNNYEMLREMCTATPNLITGLDIGHSGELYYLEGKKQLSLEKLTSALSILIPLLSNEPAGIRKDMLHLQIQKFLALAECLKQQS